MNANARWILLAVFALFVLTLTLPENAWAAKEAASSGGYLAGYEDVDPQPTEVSLWSTLAYFLSLFAVFVFVVVMAYFATRFLSGRFMQQTVGGSGRILEHLALGPKISVCVVEMADHVFLLGVTEHRVTLLSEITDEEEIERLHRGVLARPLDGGMFSQEFGTLAEFVRKIPPLFRGDSFKK